MSGIEAKVICDSISPAGKRITSLMVKCPAFITPELLRHRAFSFSFSSTRAIPASKQIAQTEDHPAMPNHWGANKPGMGPGHETHDLAKRGEHEWRRAAQLAAASAWTLDAFGLHKSIVNRVMYPFLDMHGLVTATEWDNFFALRCAPDADPVMHELAWRMWDAMQASKPVERALHLPFLTDYEATKEYSNDKTLAYASAMRCARLSYAKLDGNPSSIAEDARLAKERLADPFHMSPFEHSAVSAENDHYQQSNFIGWISGRSLYFKAGLKPWNPQQAESEGWRNAFGKTYR